MATHNITISGDIVPFTYENLSENEYCINDLQKSLNALVVAENDNVIVGINTFGGDTESGFAMYNLLQRFKNENNISLTARVDGYCASIGVVLLLAGDKRIGNQYVTPFVHNAWTWSAGDANEFIKVAEDLQKTNNKIAKLYSERTNIDFDTSIQLMNNSEYIDNEKVLEYGFYTELENQPINLILNSLSKIRNFNNKLDMNVSEQVKAIYNKLFGNVKNKIVFTAENKEVDFYELEDGDPVVLGVKANFDGQPASGEIIMSTGETYVFENGVLTEIKEVVADDEMANLKAEIEVLKTENASLKETQNSLNASLEKFKEFKNQVMNLKPDAPNVEVTPAPNVANSQNSNTTKKFNLNPKKNK